MREPGAPRDRDPDFGAGAAAWYEEGATAIAGCCGIGPDDVAAIAAVLRLRGVPTV